MTFTLQDLAGRRRMINVPTTETNRASGPQGKRILVVEDDPLIRSMLCLGLRRLGHQVLAAADGTEGAVLIEREVFHIDMLLTDISLPGVRGPELAAKALALRPDLSVVLASGSLFPEEAAGATLFGLPFLRKPFTLESLRAFIDASFVPSLDSAELRI